MRWPERLAVRAALVRGGAHEVPQHLATRALPAKPHGQLRWMTRHVRRLDGRASGVVGCTVQLRSCRGHVRPLDGRAGGVVGCTL